MTPLPPGVDCDGSSILTGLSTDSKEQDQSPGTVTLATGARGRCQTEGMAEDQVDEQREKFRQALEAKKNKGQRSGQGPSSATGAVKDSSNRAGAKREHRRKSG